MLTIYDRDIAINQTMSKLKKGFYKEPRLITASIFEMLEFEMLFNKCKFGWMTM